MAFGLDQNYSPAPKAELDFMSELRTNRKANGYQEETFEIDEWHCKQAKTIEKAEYKHSPKASDSPRIISQVIYEGWRRHVKSKYAEEGVRIILQVRNIGFQSKLARLIEGDNFRRIGGWLEPINADPVEPMLAINFSEKDIEENSDYIDELFQRISQIETLPSKIITDIKTVIACNCFYRFKISMNENGFEHAIQFIRPTLLKDVPSPYYAAALYCRQIHKYSEAHALIRYIPKTHWQFDEARVLERAIYEHAIFVRDQKISELTEKLMKLSLGNKDKPTPAAMIFSQTALYQKTLLKKPDLSSSDPQELDRRSTSAPAA